MLPKKKNHPKQKSSFHSRNKHRERYNFKNLIGTCPELEPFIKLNKYGDESIDFSNASAVLMLNKSLLMHYYGIDYWNIPKGYLCPPIPGRADYIHRISDLLGSCNSGKIPRGQHIRCLDIGVGANCIYPIIGNKEYGWSFVASDIDKGAIQSAAEIVDQNLHLKGNVELRFQANPKEIFKGIVLKEKFDLVICNPPFHSSLKDAQAGSVRKLNNLNQKQITKSTLNFGGTNSELWCDGGEKKFVQKMISESKQIPSSCLWFSTLISKEAHLKPIHDALKSAKAIDIKTIPMAHGNKISRLVAWTFLNKPEQKRWIDSRWNLTK